MTSGPADSRPWWQDAIFYQIYPRSFCLADPEGRRRRLGAAAAGAGTGADSGEDAWSPGAAPDRVRDAAGDLEGIFRHLDHLSWLGVDAVWLSPFQPSPMADFGYDVQDYCDVDPLFGNLDGFDALLGACHERGLRVIVDWVPNHTSDRHPWFEESRSSRTSAKRDWYVWRDGPPDRAPNNWRRSFGEGPAWTYDDATAQWYLHLFLPEQPDLNWANPEVRAAQEDVLAFWLDRGVDGFRIDVVHALGKDPELPDSPADRTSIPWSAQNDHPSTHEILQRVRTLLDERPSRPVSVGEVFLLDTARVATYYGAGDELHLAFNFPPMFCRFEAGCFRRRIEDVERLLGERDAWPTWVLSSHDRPRHRTRFGSERAARAAAVMLLTLRGTPFLFAGEELGLEDAEVPPEAVIDPGGRDGCRAPIPWDGTPDHGWALGGRVPWLPWPPAPGERNVAAQRAEPTSILHLYRHLIALRRATPALVSGTLHLLEVPDGVLAYERGGADGGCRVAINFMPGRAHLVGWSGRPVLVSSAGEGALCREGTTFGGVLGPEEAVVLSAG